MVCVMKTGRYLCLPFVSRALYSVLLLSHCVFVCAWKLCRKHMKPITYYTTSRYIVAQIAACNSAQQTKLFPYGNYKANTLGAANMNIVTGSHTSALPSIVWAKHCVMALQSYAYQIAVNTYERLLYFVFICVGLSVIFSTAVACYC